MSEESKILRAQQALENMFLLTPTKMSATFEDDNGDKLPIKVDYKVWPPNVLLSYYVGRVYSQDIFNDWQKRVADLSDTFDRALALIDAIDEFNNKNKTFTEGWDNAIYYK